MSIVLAEEVQKSIAEGETSLEKVWPKLSLSQKRVVIAAQRVESLAEAARQVGIQPQTVYNWGATIKTAIHLFADQAARAAHMELEDAVVEAAQLKVQELREPGTTEKPQQDVASEILDRVLGKPVQSSQVAFKGEVEHTAPTFYIPENGREISTDDTGDTSPDDAHPHPEDDTP